VIDVGMTVFAQDDEQSSHGQAATPLGRFSAQQAFETTRIPRYPEPHRFDGAAVTARGTGLVAINTPTLCSPWLDEFDGPQQWVRDS
jgi:hypothetical protein